MVDISQSSIGQIFVSYLPNILWLPNFDLHTGYQICTTYVDKMAHWMIIIIIIIILGVAFIWLIYTLKELSFLKILWFVLMRNLLRCEYNLLV